MSFDLLTCTLISDLRNQGLFQTQEKFQVLQPLIFFWVSTLKKKLGLYCKPEKKNQVATLKKTNSGSENLIFFSQRQAGKTLKIKFQGADEKAVYVSSP